MIFIRSEIERTEMVVITLMSMLLQLTSKASCLS
jgi:hypothetical protein